MPEDVISRLAAFGYAVTDADMWLINFIIGKVAETIKNECNVDEVPDGLRYVAVDMVCGEFLLAKQGSGQELGIDVEAAVKQIKEGDTQITYAIPDNSVTLDGLIDILRNGGRGQFAACRRFKW
jgi:hypothetical protein